MFRNTNDKILEIFIQTESKKLNERLETVKSKIPTVTNEYLESAISALNKEEMIYTRYADNKLCFLKVDSSAMARLQAKYEKKINDRIWDLLKIGLGFVLGVITTIIRYNLG